MRERKLIRKPNYDYSQNGFYFVTVNTSGSIIYFGDVQSDEMILNNYGQIACKCFSEIHNHFPHIKIDEFIVMPNHVHGILYIDCSLGNNDSEGNNNYCSLPWQTKWGKTISSAIRGF